MYRPDPGGNFKSDVHRRVACALPNPEEGFQSVAWILSRVDRDDYLDVDEKQLVKVTGELISDGDAEESDDGEFKLTDAGLEALTGNNAWNGGRAYGEDSE